MLSGFKSRWAIPNNRPNSRTWHLSTNSKQCLETVLAILLDILNFHQPNLDQSVSFTITSVFCAARLNWQLDTHQLFAHVKSDLQSRGGQFNFQLKPLSGNNYGQIVHTHALSIVSCWPTGGEDNCSFGRQ